MADYSEFGTRERDGWSDGSIVDAYVRHFGPITDSIAREIVATQISPGDEVLDLCCGQGTLTAALAAGGAAAMPFADAQFDKVVCNFGMMHIADQPKALSEVRRVLKPGGQFAMATWVGPGASPAFGAVFAALKANADFSAAPAQPDLFAFADPDTAREMLAGAGLDLAEHRTLPAAWRLERPEELFEIFLTATVGAGMLIRSQTAETVGKISGAITRSVRESHSDGEWYTVPAPVAMISARAA
ncbi:class I SAM-dependent methyltransferase [Mangrovicoccus sp. HB161399]|uniref:class I SAM-dependent methyltransferase n=1 Tax=Mangrovicoccus sp. HB161399 TaxID=2720392 RepID=UPI0015568AA3|nr:class I SAM-dependent methyltransferase [Mangrovicoccus sp. HB161399]